MDNSTKQPQHLTLVKFNRSAPLFDGENPTVNPSVHPLFSGHPMKTYQDEILMAYGLPAGHVLHEIHRKMLEIEPDLEGQRWLDLTYKDLIREVPYLDYDQIKRALRTLREKGVIESRRRGLLGPFDRRKSYTVHLDKVVEQSGVSLQTLDISERAYMPIRTGDSAQSEKVDNSRMGIETTHKSSQPIDISERAYMPIRMGALDNGRQDEMGTEITPQEDLTPLESHRAYMPIRTGDSAQSEKLDNDQNPVATPVANIERARALKDSEKNKRQEETENPEDRRCDISYVEDSSDMSNVDFGENRASTAQTAESLDTEEAKPDTPEDKTQKKTEDQVATGEEKAQDQQPENGEEKAEDQDLPNPPYPVYSTERLFRPVKSGANPVCSVCLKPVAKSGHKFRCLRCGGWWLPSHKVEGYSPGFEAFWDAYPRKVAKMTAWHTWVGKNFEPEAATITASLANHPAFDTDSEFIPHASTYLNNERWNDDAQIHNPRSNKVQREVDRLHIRRLAEEEYRHQKAEEQVALEMAREAAMEREKMRER